MDGRLRPAEGHLLPVAPAGAAGDYEYRVLVVPPRTSRADVRRMLADHAEYGRWELARTRLYVGGQRRFWLRRRIIRVARTA